MGKLSIQDIARILVDKNGMDAKEANDFASAMFELIHDQLNEEGLVKVKGLGTFKMIRVEARESVSVRTGERVLIDSHAKITFTPDSVMKELVNKPFSQFETVVLNDNVDFSDLKSETTSGEEMPQEQSGSMVDVVMETAMTTSTKDRIVEQESTKETQIEGEAAKETEAEKPMEEVTTTEEIAVKPEETTTKGSVTTEDATNTEDVAQEHVVETEVAVAEVTAEAPISETQETETYDDEEEESPSSNWLKVVGYVALTLVLMALSAYGGYWYGQQQMAEPTKPQPVTVVSKPASSAVEKKAMLADTLKEETTSKATPEQKPENVEAEDSKTKAETPQVASVAPSDKYDQKDARVRTGAYRIVGLAKEHKVGKGENLERISRRELGEGMSCYIEVYNDLSGDATLKEGQVIRIPKLELRKKKKQ